MKETYHDVIEYIQKNKIIIDTTDVHGTSFHSDLNILNFLAKELHPLVQYRIPGMRSVNNCHGIRLFEEDFWKGTNSGFGTIQGYKCKKFKIRTLGSVLKIEDL